MVHMINAMMGNDMYVTEERVQEYLAAGHKLAADPAEKKEKPVEDTPQGEKKRKPVRKANGRYRKASV